MWTKRRLALAGLLLVTALLLGVAGIVHSQANREEDKEGDNLQRQVAKKAKVKRETVAAVIEALGPAILAEIRLGRQVAVPGLGVFRVVRVPEHRDLRDGRPVTVAAVNYVEFVPAAAVAAAANAQGTVPAAVVPPFEYHPLQNQTPGIRTNKVRAPRIRTR